MPTEWIWINGKTASSLADAPALAWKIVDFSLPTASMR